MRFIFVVKRDENYIMKIEKKKKYRRKIAHFICNLIYDDNIHRRDVKIVHTLTLCFENIKAQHFVCIEAILDEKNTFVLLLCIASACTSCMLLKTSFYLCKTNTVFAGFGGRIIVECEIWRIVNMLTLQLRVTYSKQYTEIFNLTRNYSKLN